MEPAVSPSPSVASRPRKPVTIREPNKTEARYALTYLEPRKRAGEILDYHYEAIRLRIGDAGERCSFVIDWVAFRADGLVECIEVKGGHTWDDALVKFKAARRLYPGFVWVWARWDRKTWDRQEWAPKVGRT